MHVECCEIDDILSDNGGISPPPDDDAEGDEQLEKELHLQDVREECDICLEKVLKNDLEQHREMCSPRIVYHCAICSDDYLSKEGLWNHLDLHEVRASFRTNEIIYSELVGTDCPNIDRNFREFMPEKRLSLTLALALCISHKFGGCTVAWDKI